MDKPVGLTIEKIKLQEQDKEAKLKEKREFEANVAHQQRVVREVLVQIEKLNEEETILTSRYPKLLSQLEIEKIKKRSFVEQVELLKHEIQKLQNQINHDISTVWNLRSSFCEKIQKTSDEYNVWALLMKPVCYSNSEPTTEKYISNKTNDDKALSNKERLQAAVERRNIAIKKRNDLLTEPDNGDEFVRIKNALRYSMEKIADLKKSNFLK